MGVGAGGTKGLSYLDGWGLWISSPFGGMVGGGEASSTALEGGAEVKVLPGDQQRDLEAEGERGAVEEERERAWGEMESPAEAQESRRAPMAEGLPPSWEKGLRRE